MNSIPRRHHVYPQLLQRNWMGEDGRVFIFDKRRPERGVLRLAPKDALVEKDLNTVVRTDGSKDVGLEEWYSKLEGDVAPIVEKIVTEACCGRAVALTDDERNTWDNFVYIQQKRAPDVFTRLGVEADMPGQISEHMAWYEANVRSLTEAERAQLSSPEGFKRMLQMARVTARGYGGDEIVPIMAERGFSVGIPAESKKSFIFGDHPLARFGGRLDDPKTEVLFPIAPDVVVISVGLRAQGGKFVRLAGDAVRKVNSAIFENSNVVGSRSERLLLSLAGLR